MKKRIFLFCLLLAFLLPSSVAAAPLMDDPPPDDTTNYCQSATPKEGTQCLSLFHMLSAWMSETLINISVSAIGVIDMIVWFFARLTLTIFDLAVNGTWLETLREDVLKSLESFMPALLKELFFGLGDFKTGLSYIALMLAGVTMTIPFLYNGVNQFVKPDRVVLWSLLIISLFILENIGLDTIGKIEKLRSSVVRVVMGGAAATESVNTLVLTPIDATTDEAKLSMDNLAQLPGKFLGKHFPEIQRGTVTIRLAEQFTVLGSTFKGVLNTEIETTESKKARIMGAARALLYGFITLLAAISVLLFAGAFVFLGVAAILLIIFLMAALPLGFFEFGTLILGGIGKQYVTIVSYSLVLAMLLRLFATLVGQLSSSVDDPKVVIEWILMLGTLILAMKIIFSASFKSLTNSFASLGGSYSGMLGMGNAAGLATGAVGLAAGALTGGATLAMGAAEKVKTTALNTAQGGIIGGLMSGGARGAIGLGALGGALGVPPGLISTATRGDVWKNNGKPPESGRQVLDDKRKEAKNAASNLDQTNDDVSTRPLQTSSRAQDLYVANQAVIGRGQSAGGKDDEL